MHFGIEGAVHVEQLFTIRQLEENQENKWQEKRIGGGDEEIWLKILGVSEVNMRGHVEKAISDARCVF